MVVLDLEGSSHMMLGSGPNQYLSPDYMSPLSSPLDSKASPLALLAQTCSQIGSDGPPSKSIFDTSKRKLSTCSESSVKSESSDSSSKETVVVSNKESVHLSSNRPKSGSNSSSLSPATPLVKSNGGGGKMSPLLSPSSVSPNPVFKPYEIPNRKEDRSEKREGKSGSNNKINAGSKSSSNSISPKVKTPNQNQRSSTPKEQEISVVDSKSKSKVPSGSSSSSSNNDPPKSSASSDRDHGASPIIRSGLEVLQQNQFGASAAEYAKYSALQSLAGIPGYPAGFDPLNPAFRPPFVGAPHSAAHPFGAYPPIPGGSPYVSYSRVKTGSGETIVPVCKNPYCTGCPFGGGGVPHGTAAASQEGHGSAGMNGLMAAAAAAAAARYPPTSSAGYPSSSPSSGGICPAGCVAPCDHPKFPLSSLPHLFPPSLSPGYPSSLLNQHAAAAASAQQSAQQRPFVCNWIVGDNYCGKRFPSSEELLQHLRTHTNSASASSNTTAPATSSAESSAIAAAMLQQQQLLALSSPSSSLYSALLNPSTMAALQRSYPTPPLSPLSAARYHPYAAAMAMAGKSSLGPPMPSAYYNPYSALLPKVHQ